MIITRFTSGMQAPGGVGPQPRLGGMGVRHDPRSVGSECHFPYPVGWSRFFGVAPREHVRRMGIVSADGAQSVSVVIPAFNAERTLGAVLDALAHDPQPPDEVIVVDDGSTDLTAQIARAHGARVVDGGRVGYAGGARHRGWDAAAGDGPVVLAPPAPPAPRFRRNAPPAGRPGSPAAGR